MTRVPADTHEWVSFEDDEEDRTWVFDVTFLLSKWKCIYGAGCQGVLTGPAPELEQGCCSYGAHFVDSKDRKRVERAARKLTPDQWQFYKQGHERGVTKVNKAGDAATRLVQNACIFLNRPDFPGGAGCALHRAALETGGRPLDVKPDVCWQLPIRRDDLAGDDGHLTTTIGQWERRHWGGGGPEFHWWCTESPEAFIGQTAVYESMRDELVELVGAPIYRKLVLYLDERRNDTPLAHPVVRLTTKAKS